ncbi:hypothetical protein J2T21_003061, partial [Paeniglutamicibacter psychrophenolicus]|nr:hypothetical protein [Paeniglutamicibacter psychrophenolicus]
GGVGLPPVTLAGFIIYVGSPGPDLRALSPDPAGRGRAVALFPVRVSGW